MEQQIGSKKEKEYVKAIYCHCAYLMYMQSTSWETLGWMKHKLESRLQGDILITSDMQVNMTLMAESEEELKNLLMKVKDDSEKVDLKLNIQKTKIMATSPIIAWQTDGETSGNSGKLYFVGLQNHCRWWLKPWNKKMLTPWKESDDQPRQHIKKRRHHFDDQGLYSQS